MKLSDLKDDDIEMTEPAKHADSIPLRLSEIHSDDITSLSKEEKQQDNVNQAKKQYNNDFDDLAQGVAHGVPLIDKLGGGIQSGMDIMQRLGHTIAPGSIGASPTQVSAALQKLGVKGDLGPTSEQKLFNQGEQESKDAADAAQKRSPWLYGAGEIAGSLPLWEAGGLGLKSAKGAGLLTKAGTAAANVAPLGALYGISGSKGSLSQDPGQLAKDAAIGAGTASLLGGGLKLAGEAAAGTETGKRIAGNFNMGAEGQDLSSKESRLGTLANPESLGDTVSMHDTQAANTVLDGLNTMDDHLGQEVGKVVADGTQKGITIEPTPELNKQIIDLEQNLGNTDFTEVMRKMSTEGLNPNELQEFRNDLADYGRKIYMSDPVGSSKVFDTTKELTQMLRQNVPGYSDAATRLNEFRRSLPETILSKDNPIDVTNLRVSGTRNVDTKLLNNIKSMIRGMYNPNNAKAQGSYTNLLQGIQKLSDSEQARKIAAQAAGKPFETVFDKLGMQPQDIESFFKDAAAKSKIIQNYTGLPDIDLTHPIKTVQNGADWLANKAGVAKNWLTSGGTGSAAQNPVLNVGKKLYSASDDSLRGLSQKLNDIPGQKPMSTALNNALDSKDSVAKNAVLFSIMQNPSLRNLVGSDNLTTEPQ